MIDERLSNMNKKDLAIFQANRRASEKADKQFELLR